MRSDDYFLPTHVICSASYKGSVLQTFSAQRAIRESANAARAEKRLALK